MKKPKISLDKDKLQQLFLLHIEKILLVIVVGLMVLLVYRGFSLPHLEPTLSPQALIDKTRGAKQYIDDPNRWNEVSIQEPTRVPDFSIVKQVEKVQMPSDPMAYMLVNTWSRPDFPKLSPREDPTLFAPEKLIVRPVVGPLASYPRSESEMVDPLFPQKTEEQIRAERKKKEIEDKKKKKEEEKLAGGGEGMPGGTQRKKKGKPGAGEEGGEMAGSTRRGGPMAYGGEYGAANPGGLYPEAAGLGYLPQNAEQTIARDVASVTLMAVVPIQRQTEEYDKKFTNALDYDPRRDAPYYREYRVQRVDVTDVDPATEIEKLPWEALPRPSNVLAELYGDERTPGLYAGTPTEVIDMSYWAEQLTHPAPPYLARDLWDLLTHPEVPLAAVNPGYAEGVPGATKPAGTTGDEPDAPSAPAFGAPGMPGMPGMLGGGEGGYGGGMRPGMNRMGGGGEGGMPGGMPGMGGGMRPGGGMTMPRPGGGAPMMGGGEGGYGAGMQTYTPPKYQLIRFTDVNVKPGRKYRYRVRLMVDDPNHPMLGVTPPTSASLAETARKRVKEIDTADAARPKDKQTGLAYRTYWLWTPWSEPSPIADVPHGERVYAGKVNHRAPMKVKHIDGSDEPSATALAVVFAHDKVADVPAELMNMRRGYVLNVTLDPKPSDKDKPKVIHPVTKEIVDLTDKFNLVTNAMVADLMGGEDIRPIVTGTASQKLTNIGEMLIMDASGKLHVQNEADDILQFRRYTVPKEEKTKKAKDDTAGGLEGMPGGRPRRGTD